MKFLGILPFLLTLSCIDLINQKIQYNSLYFTGGSWIEMAQIDSMKIGSNDYTLQFWASGGAVDTNEAPALFSLIDSTDKITLAILRDSNKQNRITTVINSNVSTHGFYKCVTIVRMKSRKLKVGKRMVKSYSCKGDE